MIWPKGLAHLAYIAHKQHVDAIFAASRGDHDILSTNNNTAELRSLLRLLIRCTLVPPSPAPSTASRRSFCSSLELTTEHVRYSSYEGIRCWADTGPSSCSRRRTEVPLGPQGAGRPFHRRRRPSRTSIWPVWFSVRRAAR